VILIIMACDYKVTCPNKRVETNRRPALPFDAERDSEIASCAPPFLPAAVAHPFRWAAGWRQTLGHR
jgi:hypothetical protein